MRLIYIVIQKIYVFFYSLLFKDNRKVLMFHEINNKEILYSVKTDCFEEFINNNFNKIGTINELKDNKCMYVLTFDDAYDSVYFNAKQILDKYNVPYYVFICNEYIDKEGYLNKEMIKEIANSNNGFIGSHLYKHLLCRKNYQEDVEAMMLKSKNELFYIIKKEVEDFAFPYGSIYAVRKCDVTNAKKIFKNVYSTLAISYNNKIKIIPRFNMNDKTIKEVMK